MCCSAPYLTRTSSAQLKHISSHLIELNATINIHQYHRVYIDYLGKVPQSQRAYLLKLKPVITPHQRHPAHQTDHSVLDYFMMDIIKGQQFQSQ